MKIKTMYIILNICFIIVGVGSLFETNMSSLKFLLIFSLLCNSFFIKQYIQGYENKSINIDLNNILMKLESKLKISKED